MSKNRVLIFLITVVQLITIFILIFIGRVVLAQDENHHAATVAPVDGSMIITNQQLFQEINNEDVPMLPIAYGYVEADSSYRGTPNVTVTTFLPGGYKISIDNVDCGDFAAVAHCVVLVTAVDGAPTSVVALGGDINVYTYAGSVPANNAFQFVVYGL